MANNHVIDPTFFYQCIETFSFDYTFYRKTTQHVDEYYDQQKEYEHFTVRGSLQSRGKKLIQRKDGNIIEVHYDFYCKSLYRVDEGDFIIYNHRLLRCTEVSEEYDEYGVRAAHFIEVELSAYQDLLEYVKYVTGEELV